MNASTDENGVRGGRAAATAALALWAVAMIGIPPTLFCMATGRWELAVSAVGAAGLCALLGAVCAVFSAVSGDDDCECEDVGDLPE